MRKWIIGVLLALLVLSIASCMVEREELGDKDGSIVNQQKREEDGESQQPEEETTKEVLQDSVIDDEKVKLTMGGDLMFHESQLETAYDRKSQEYDFMSSFVVIEDELMLSDYVFANLESTFSGPPYTGYPRFSTPDSAVKAIKASGIDFVTTANNHCMDYGLEGLIRTLEILDEEGIKHTGTYKEKVNDLGHYDKERKSDDILDVHGLRLQVINYTYGMNNYDNNPYKGNINSLDFYDGESLNRLYRDVEDAEGSDVDYVLVFLHFGEEYDESPNENQIKLAHDLVNLGADIIIGSHPHKVQAIELMWELDNQVLKEPKVIAYSLGDFLSSTKAEGLEADDFSGILVNLEFDQENSLTWRLTGIGILPISCKWEGNQRVIIPMFVNNQLSDNAKNDIKEIFDDDHLGKVRWNEGWYWARFD